MNKNLFSFIFLCFFIFIFGKNTLTPTTISMYEEVVFYDMYDAIVNEPLPPGATRLSNSTYTKKMTDAQLDSFGNQVTMNVTIGALCDNYDRLAHVFLAFAPILICLCHYFLKKWFWKKRNLLVTQIKIIVIEILAQELINRNRIWKSGLFIICCWEKVFQFK